MLPDLPVAEALPALRAALRDGPNAVLVAPPGAGKTTLVPLVLRDEPWAAGGKLLVLDNGAFGERLLERREVDERLEDGTRLAVNPTGNPGMATGGCGDVLTGLLAALLAGKLPAYEAAVLGAWVHGRAGDLQAYLAADIAFHRTLLEATGNEMFGALADVVAEVLTGRTTHGLMPMNPNPAAVRLHADVAQAVQAGDPQAAHDAMTSIITEANSSVASSHGVRRM